MRWGLHIGGGGWTSVERLLGAFVLVELVLAGCGGPSGPEERQPAAVISLGSATTAPPDGSVELPIRIQYIGDGRSRLDAFAGFDFLIAFDSSQVTLANVRRGDAISEWEYFTWRSGWPSNSKPCCIDCPLSWLRIIAMRDLDNEESPGQSQALPEGTLADVTFFVGTGYHNLGESTEVGFYACGCGDNVFTAADQSLPIFMADSVFPGSDSDAMFDTMGCARRYRFAPVLSYQGATIMVGEPEGGFRPCDVNLDGIVPQVSDAVVLSNFLIDGFAAPVTRLDSLILEASDCNCDGEPMTEADLEFMLRIITGDTLPCDTLSQ
jgi:hypothetical protein